MRGKFLKDRIPKDFTPLPPQKNRQHPLGRHLEKTFKKQPIESGCLMG